MLKFELYLGLGLVKKLEFNSNEHKITDILQIGQYTQSALLGNQLMLSVQCKCCTDMTLYDVIKAQVTPVFDVWPYSCVCMGITRWLCEQQINGILSFPQSFLRILLWTSGCWSSKNLCSQQHRHTRGQFTTLILCNKEFHFDEKRESIQRNELIYAGSD